MQTLACLLLLLLLASLVSSSSGFPAVGMYLARALLPSQSLFSAKTSPWDGRLISMSGSFDAPVAADVPPTNPLLELSMMPAPSPMDQGYASHLITTGCKSLCITPLSASMDSHCRCVVSMEVDLVLDVPSYEITARTCELANEVAAGTCLNQSQVLITDVGPDSRCQDKTAVSIKLVPLGSMFDASTAMWIYERFRRGKVQLNKRHFGQYKLVRVTYPGLPQSPPPPPPAGARDDPRPVPIPPTPVSDGKSHKVNRSTVVIIALSTLLFLFVSCGAGAILLRIWKVGRQSSLSSVTPSDITGSLTSISTIHTPLLNVKTFSHAELMKATKNFSRKNILGEGGFARVYHGTLEDGSEVAVKLLRKDIRSKDHAFMAEVSMQSRLHHRNLVKLIGMCAEGRTRCLVYELVRNGSIESHLHGDDKRDGGLDWGARLKIALGAARGLAYLHEDSSPRVIHRDFKAANVLLENDFTAKVADFGLAREANRGSRHVSTRVMGTFGYVAPEYAMTGHLLVKSDVYSYGIVLLELLTGRKPVDPSLPPGEEVLVVWARPLLGTREGLQWLVDPTLAGKFDIDDLAKVAAIASKCVESEVDNRPYMGEVVQALKLVVNDGGDDSFSRKESSYGSSAIGGPTSSSGGRVSTGGGAHFFGTQSGPLSTKGRKPPFDGWIVTVDKRGHEAPF